MSLLNLILLSFLVSFVFANVDEGTTSAVKTKAATTAGAGAGGSHHETHPADGGTTKPQQSHPAGTPGGTSSSGTTTSSKTCFENKDCGSCTQQMKCVWCDPPLAADGSVMGMGQGTGHCVDGMPWGPGGDGLSSIIKGFNNTIHHKENNLCPTYHWKVCGFLNGMILFYGALSLLALICLCCSCCIIYCCCCRAMCKRGKGKGKELSSVTKGADRASSTDTEPLIKHHSKNAERREAMRAKWGIGDPEAV